VDTPLTRNHSHPLNPVVTSTLSTLLPSLSLFNLATLSVSNSTLSPYLFCLPLHPFNLPIFLSPPSPSHPYLSVSHSTLSTYLFFVSPFTLSSLPFRLPYTLSTYLFFVSPFTLSTLPFCLPLHPIDQPFFCLPLHPLNPTFHSPPSPTTLPLRLTPKPLNPTFLSPPPLTSQLYLSVSPP
jgi:hypothetical protein